MRRALLALMTAPVLVLAACDGDAGTQEPTPESTPAGQTAPADPEDDGTTATADAAPDDAASSSGGPDTASGTAGPDEVEGGAEGQAAADRAKAFLIALVKADPAACDLLISFTDRERPMADVPEDLELCREQLPATMASTVEAQGLDEEGIAVLEAMQITGADVQGEVAVVDSDNYSPLFADAMGEATITLNRLGDEWYVDLDAYLDTP